MGFGTPGFAFNPYQGYNPYPNNPIANPQSSAYDPRYFTQIPGQMPGAQGPQTQGPQPASGSPPSPSAAGTQPNEPRINQPQTNYNVNMGQQQQQQPNQQQAPGGPQAPLQFEPNPMVDPFAMTELGQLLRLLSSGYARSPYGQHLGGGQEIGGFPAIGGGGSAQPVQHQSGPIGYQPSEYLAPIGPLEHSFRSRAFRSLLGGQPYDGLRGPDRSLGYRPSGYGGQATQTTGTPAIHPELWDPYAGLFQWDGRTWAPQWVGA